MPAGEGVAVCFCVRLSSRRSEAWSELVTVRRSPSAGAPLHTLVSSVIIISLVKGTEFRAFNKEQERRSRASSREQVLKVITICTQITHRKPAEAAHLQTSSTRTRSFGAAESVGAVPPACLEEDLQSHSCAGIPHRKCVAAPAVPYSLRRPVMHPRALQATAWSSRPARARRRWACARRPGRRRRAGPC